MSQVILSQPKTTSVELLRNLAERIARHADHVAAMTVKCGKLAAFPFELTEATDELVNARTALAGELISIKSVLSADDFAVVIRMADVSADLVEKLIAEFVPPGL